MKGRIAKIVLCALLISLGGLIKFPLESIVAAEEVGQEPAVLIFEDELVSCCYTYQTSDLFDLDIKDKMSGRASLRLGWDVPAGNWPGAGLGLVEVSDFTPYRENGVLSLWIRSDNGGEKIDVGFVDKDGYITRKPLDLYIGSLTTEWQKVEIPLKDFSDRATHWDEALGKNVPGDFKWDAVLEVAFVFGRADGDEHWINVDEIVILMNE